MEVEKEARGKPGGRMFIHNEGNTPVEVVAWERGTAEMP